MTTGRVRRGYLGIAGQTRPIERKLAHSLGLTQESGIEVMSLERNGPAAKAGLRKGDIVLALEDRAMSTVDDIHRFLNEWAIGEPTTVSFIRENELSSLRLVPGEAPQ